MTPERLAILFLREQLRFAEHYPRLHRASLGLRRWRRQSGRDFAMAYRDRNEVLFHRDALAELTEAQAVGIIRHELGHLADPTPDAPEAERRADRIAEEVTGVPMLYDDNDVQNACCGRSPRPRYLHR